MKIATEKENGTLTITLSGKLDTTSAPELEKALTEQADGVTSLVFDLGELSYTSSAGLRVFLKARKMMRSRDDVRLIHTAASVLEVLEMTGFTEIMTVETAE